MTHPRSLARITARIHERVAHCLAHELKDPRAAFLTVLRVELSPDASLARVYYSVLGSKADRSKVQRMLESATGFVRTRVARVLETRRVPRIVWQYDDSIEHTARVGDVIREALERDRSINPAAHGELPPEEPVVDPEIEVQQEYNEFLDEQEDGRA